MALFPKKYIYIPPAKNLLISGNHIFFFDIQRKSSPYRFRKSVYFHQLSEVWNGSIPKKIRYRRQKFVDLRKPISFFTVPFQKIDLLSPTWLGEVWNGSIPVEIRKLGGHEAKMLTPLLSMSKKCTSTAGKYEFCRHNRLCNTRGPSSQRARE